MFTRLNKKQFDVLEPFFEDPGLEASIRELSRKSGVSARWVSKTVDKLAAEDFLEVEEGKAVKSVGKGEKFGRLKRVYNLNALYDSGLVDALETGLRPDALVLFGSFEKGEDLKDSDIDIAVINGREGLDLSHYEEELNRDISLHHVENPEEVDENFRNSLANGTVLSGYFKVV